MARITTTDGTELRVRDTGPRDGRPVVLLHGWTVGTELWERQLATLPAHGLRAVAYDRRGCGHSDKPFDGYDYDTLAADLEAVLAALDLRDVTLVAHSLAVGEAARYRGDRVGRLVLVGPTTPTTLPDELVDAMAEMMHADLPAFLAAGAPAFFGGQASEAMLAWGVGMAGRASLRASVELIRTMATTDLKADLAAIDVPTVVVHGDADTTATVESNGRPTAELVPGADLVVVEGAPHGLPLTHPDELAAVLLR